MPSGNSAEDVVKTWVYSMLRDRMIRSPECDLSLVKRIKPQGALQRLRSPFRYRVERYHQEGATTGASAEGNSYGDVAVKYTLGSDPRVRNEIVAVGGLTLSGAHRHDGILLPQVVDVEWRWGRGKGLVSPWKEGGTLDDYVQGGRVMPERLAVLLGRCGQVLRALHTVQAGSSDATTEQGQRRSSLHLGRIPSGDPVAAAQVERVLSAIPLSRVEACLGQSWCWIHGDCFGYQFVMEDEESLKPWLCDWDSARLDMSGLFDVAQLWASLELAFHLDDQMAPHMGAFWAAFQNGYGLDLGRDLLFRVLELRALVRFSPRMQKFNIVVPRPRPSPRRAPWGMQGGRVVDAYDKLLHRRIQLLRELL